MLPPCFFFFFLQAVVSCIIQKHLAILFFDVVTSKPHFLKKSISVFLQLLIAEVTPMLLKTGPTLQVLTSLLGSPSDCLTGGARFQFLDCLMF